MDECRLIIADDHEIFREGLKSLIDKEESFKIVGEANDGIELMKLLEKKDCDIVITDLSMPKMDGMAAIQKIKRLYAHIHVLVLTMLKDHEHFKHAMASGAKGYLLKDDAFDQFARAIHQIARGKQYVSSSVESLITERFVRSLEETETPSLDILTRRERQILELIAQGQANKNIASNLNISIRTVETHRINLTNKLGIKNTAGLVKYSLSKGLI